MSTICYTLEEAAQRLQLTETVLVRLSHYFRVPNAAYEESGYLSFKGDLLFNEQEMAFFNEVKKRLLNGETLETVKRTTTPHHQPTKTDHRFSAYIKPVGAAEEITAEASTLPEIQTSQPYQKAADHSFKRYKHIHHPEPKMPVLKNILQATTKADASASAADKDSTRSSLNSQVSSNKPKERLIPFLRQQAPIVAPVEQNVLLGKQAPGEITLTALMEKALAQPRALNAHLKTAAVLIRQQATAQPKAKRNLV